LGAQAELNRFFDPPMNIGRNPAKINGLDRRNKALARRAVFFGFPPSAPEQLHSMGSTAFGTDTLDGKAVPMIVSAEGQTFQFIRYTVAVADLRHFHTSP
jgi:hypothetical protein